MLQAIHTHTLSLVESVHIQCQHTQRALHCVVCSVPVVFEGAHNETNSGKQSLICSHAQHWKMASNQLFDWISHSTFHLYIFSAGLQAGEDGVGQLGYVGFSH